MELTLSNLRPTPGARRKRRRIGRGESSGWGKTAGRGGKGQTARTGGTIARHFEGGQMPLYRRIPKLGFRSRKQVLGTNDYVIVTLTALEALGADGAVGPDVLAARLSGSTSADGLRFKVLANGELSKAVTVRAHAVSAAARRRIEECGGSVELIGA